jgi:hypothetical protein
MERLFDRKIIMLQTVWEENIKNSTPSSPRLAFITMCHALMPINKMGQEKESIVIS